MKKEVIVEIESILDEDEFIDDDDFSIITEFKQDFNDLGLTKQEFKELAQKSTILINNFLKKYDNEIKEILEKLLNEKERKIKFETFWEEKKCLN